MERFVTSFPYNSRFVSVSGRIVAPCSEMPAKRPREREYESMNVPRTASIVRDILAAAKVVGAEVVTGSVGGGSDANVYNRRGIEAANLGTGMRAIHTLDEWLDLEDFYRCANVVFEFVRAHAA